MLLTDGNRQRSSTQSMLIEAWNEGVKSVKGDICVSQILKQYNITPPKVIMSVGKAASSMAIGALQWFQAQFPQVELPQVIVVTKYGHVESKLSKFENISIIEAGHPLPDEASLKAGNFLLKKLKEMPVESQLLFLVSGGASSLVEKLEDGIGLDYLQKINQKFFTDGTEIEAINKDRSKYSKLKNGKLLEHFLGKKLDIIYISDVKGDDLKIVGSGIGSPYLLQRKKTNCAINIYLGGANNVARQAVEAYFTERNLKVIANQEILYDDVFILSRTLVQKIISGEDGIYIFGGEPSIKLPPSPGQGGRNQSLALAVAKEINQRSNIFCLVAGTDGTDGPTNAAGGMVDGSTFDDQQYAKNCLEAANAGEYLKKNKSLFSCGPTGTNVMDIMIVLKA